MSVRAEVGPSVVREGAVRAAIFSTYPPRECGIGTFSFDVRSALLDVPAIGDVSAVVVGDDRSTPQRSEVLTTVCQGVRGDYVRAARLLGALNIDVVRLQHEFGIFGGSDGEYVLSFAPELTQPLVVTLHTVLSQPSPRQLRVLAALCDQAERVIVMTDTARHLLLDVGASAPAKIRVVPHGAPVELGRRREDLAAGRRSLYLALAHMRGCNRVSCCPPSACFLRGRVSRRRSRHFRSSSSATPTCCI